MRRVIHHIRRQPEKLKMHILHFLTVVFGIFLLVLWVYSLGRNVANPETQNNFKNNLKPFSALKDNLVGGYNSISQPNLPINLPQ